MLWVLCVSISVVTRSGFDLTDFTRRLQAPAPHTPAPTVQCLALSEPGAPQSSVSQATTQTHDTEFDTDTEVGDTDTEVGESSMEASQSSLASPPVGWSRDEETEPPPQETPVKQLQYDDDDEDEYEDEDEVEPTFAHSSIVHASPAQAESPSHASFAVCTTQPSFGLFSATGDSTPMR